MSNTNIFLDGYNLDQNDINTNIDLYYLQKVNNGAKKMIASYPDSFLLDNNNNCRFFNIDPYNVGKFVAYGDSWTSGNVWTTQSNCWANLLATDLNKSILNLALSGSSSNEVMVNTNMIPTLYNDGLNDKMSSIILYGLNDYRCNFTLYSSTRGWEYTKMLADLYAFCSMPKKNDCWIPARSMTQTSGVWNIDTSTPTSLNTNGFGNTLEYTFINKRYIYVSFIMGPVANVKAKWDILVNDVIQCCEYQTSIPTINNRLSLTTYTSGAFIDLGSNQNFRLTIRYMSSAETNDVNYCCCYNDDDVLTNGRHCLVLSPPRMGYSYSVSTNFTTATETKRIYLMNCQIDAVRLCQRMGLNVFYHKQAPQYPLNNDNLHPTKIGQVRIKNNVKKYLQLNNLSS